MARRKSFLRLPVVGKLNLKSPNTWILAGVAGLGVLWYLAQSGRSTGIGFVDQAADTFENY